MSPVIDKEGWHELVNTHVAHTAQWTTSSGWYSHNRLTCIFLMEWCSVWQIQQSTLVLVDYLFTMPHHMCAWGTCNSDSRHKDRDYMNDVGFYVIKHLPRRWFAPGLAISSQSLKKRYVPWKKHPGRNSFLPPILEEMEETENWWNVHIFTSWSYPWKKSVIDD